MPYHKMLISRKNQTAPIKIHKESCRCFGTKINLHQSDRDRRARVWRIIGSAYDPTQISLKFKHAGVNAMAWS